MKTLATILLETIGGTLVVVVCLSLPELLGLPLWTLPAFAVPALLYFDWRLGESHWTRPKILRFVVALSVIFYLWIRFLPTEYWWTGFILGFLLPRKWLFGHEETRSQGSDHVGS